MTASTASTEPTVAQAVRRAAVRATLAPSVHNTQPWRFVLGADSLEIFADWNRRLQVLDPRGRQLLVSCGCAVFNARVASAAARYEVTVDRFPDPFRPDLVARLLVHNRGNHDVQLGSLDSAIETRHTNRRRLSDEAVPDLMVATLVAMAEQEGAQVVVIDRPEHRQAVALLIQQADQIENNDPACRAELHAWTPDDWRGRDGVPLESVRRASAGTAADLPLHDFAAEALGWLPSATDSSADSCLLLLGTVHDTPAAWVQAGEALERVLLEATRQGYLASPLTQLIEVAVTNALLREQLQLNMNPHVLLRIGQAAATPASRRRRLVDMLDTSG
jgi:nitroreductase